MQYKVFKLAFKTSVHFGDGGLTKSRNTLCADTIFSALCIEALKQGCLDELVQAVKEDRLLISDGLPFIGDRLYIPKPYLQLNIDHDGDSVMKKSLKKLAYIPVDQLDAYLQGMLAVNEEEECFRKCFGTYSLIEKAAIIEEDDAKPYAVSIFTYKEDSGLYICVGYERDDDYYMLSDLLESLSYTGIGGRRSSGYGRFELKMGKMSETFKKRLDSDKYNTYISLSAALPTEEELEKVLENASYQLIRRGGFIDSTTYADNYQKRKEVYLMTAGSSFETSFQGELLDVSDYGAHPVYKYAKAMLMGVM